MITHTVYSVRNSDVASMQLLNKGYYMENLNTILGVNLHTASIFDINEEKLLLLKSEDYYTKSDLFFFLQNELLKNKDNKDAYSYINYLISYS